MKKRWVIGWVFLLLLPLAGFAWLGFEWAEQEQARLDRALDQLLIERLRRWVTTIGEMPATLRAGLALQAEPALAGPLTAETLAFETAAIELPASETLASEPITIVSPLLEPSTMVTPASETQAAASPAPAPPLTGTLPPATFAVGDLSSRPAVVSSSLLIQETIRRLERRSQVKGVFVVAADGRLLYPDAQRFPGEQDAVFRRNLQPLLDSGAVTAPLAPDEDAATASLSRPGLRGAASSGSGEWIPWFSGNGLRLFLRFRTDNGAVLGIELNRSRLLADVIQLLPQDDGSAQSPAHMRIRLEGPSGQVLYQWGAFSPPPDARPRVELPLPAPLGAWKLRHFLAPERINELRGAGSQVQVLLNLLVLAVLMALTAFFLSREQQRSWREAQEKVSFVNKVSHELKTPLTNIRLHAELLAEDLGTADAPEDVAASGPARRVAIIVGECRRLSRLIANVLTFARREQHPQALQVRRTAVGDLVRGVMDRFAPVLGDAGFRCETVLDCPDELVLDPDVLEQILGNLLSNAEKYASGGKWLAVRVRYDPPRLLLEVADHGPGIPAALREKVFEPFFRISDRLDEGVTGTGIGLAIVRDLARLHGGDVALADADGPADGPGVCVRVSLHIESGGES